MTRTKIQLPDDLYQRAKSFARRRSYDWRMALILHRQGVTELAAVNAREFEGLGFSRVWNPLVDLAP
jgi:hypothetical protein